MTPSAVSKQQRALIVIVLTAAALAVFGQLRAYDFVNWDDPNYVYNNPHVRAGLTRAGIVWAFTTFDYFYWSPLTWLSHMLDCQFFGVNAGYHHLTNVLFHVFNSVLVFLVLRRMTGAVWRSAIVAGLFALHPLRVESVSWIAERKDVLSGFWLLMTIWAYARYAERPSNTRYVLVLAGIVLGLMSKPMLVTVPLLLLALDYWPLRRRALAEKIPMAILAGISALLTAIGQYRMGAVATHIPLSFRVANALVSYGRYLAKTLWPRNLAILYAYPKWIPAWQSMGAALLLASITAAVFLVRRRHPYLLFGWCWFVVGLVPTIGLMQAGRQAMADRFTYIPLLGVFAAAVWGSAAAIGQRPRSAAIFASAVLAVCGVVSWFQVRTWRDSITVFEHAVAVTEPTSVAHRNLGSALQARGDLGGAVLHYEEALRIQPSNFVARYDYGAALLALDKLEEASRQLATVVRECPTCADPYYRLGEIAIRRGNRSEAEILMHEALRRGLEGQAAASARMELAAIEGRRAAAQ